MNLKKQIIRNNITGIVSIMGFILILYTLPEVLARTLYHTWNVLAFIFYASFVLLAYGFIIFTIFFTSSLKRKPIEELKGRNIPIQIINEGRKIVRYTSIAAISVVTFGIVLMHPFVRNLTTAYYISQELSNLINYLGMFIILLASFLYKEYHVALPYNKKDRKGKVVYVGIWKCLSCGESNSDARKKCFYCDNYNSSQVS